MSEPDGRLLQSLMLIYFDCSLEVSSEALAARTKSRELKTFPLSLRASSITSLRGKMFPLI
jgi:hypothetical protein